MMMVDDNCVVSTPSTSDVVFHKPIPNGPAAEVLQVTQGLYDTEPDFGEDKVIVGGVPPDMRLNDLHIDTHKFQQLCSDDKCAVLVAINDQFQVNNRRLLDRMRALEDANIFKDFLLRKLVKYACRCEHVSFYNANQDKEEDFNVLMQQALQSQSVRIGCTLDASDDEDF